MSEIKVSISKCGDTILGHAQGHVGQDEFHAILLQAHKVIVFNDDGGFFAQGLEFDHFAQGNSEEDAIKNYTDSFEWNVQKHLEMYGDLSNWTVPAPKEVWSEFEKAVSTHILEHIGSYEVKATLDEEEPIFDRLVSFLKISAPPSMIPVPA